MDLPGGQIPDEPGIHRAGAQLAPLRPLPDAGDVIQDPFDLRTGKVSVDQQAGLVRHRLGPAIGLELVTDGGGAAALPHDGVVYRPPGGPLPQDGSLPLVSDAQGRDLLGVDMGGVHRLRQSLFLHVPKLRRVVLHPAGLGIDLPEGVLGPGHDLPRPVK